eukprot:8444957-Alexandrium_andersonii.AAC.1
MGYPGEGPGRRISDVFALAPRVGAADGGMVLVDEPSCKGERGMGPGEAPGVQEEQSEGVLAPASEVPSEALQSAAERAGE